jgi:hypothetical protein
MIFAYRDKVVGVLCALREIDRGVTVEQVARVTHNFTEAGSWCIAT